MAKCIETSENAGLWTLQSGIFPENEASLKLHEKHGFRVVGFRERIGQMRNGLWRDIVFMERRSKTVGI
jgi:phosphinothricin acetyltransferase